MNEMSWPLRVLIERYGDFRKETWKAAVRTVRQYALRNLVETGCFRGTDADGWSTIILARLAKDVGGRLDSYEINRENIATAKSVLQSVGLSNFVTFHEGDSVLNLARRTQAIDFAYLDSFDCGEGPDYGPCQKHQLAEFEAVLPLFNPKAAVLLDDHIPATGGKTKLTIQRLESLGWQNLATGYQVLYFTRNAQELKPHKFAVLCGHLDEYAALSVHTLYHNRAQYCLRHGYDLRLWRQVHPCFQDQQSHASGYSWSRLMRLLELLESGAYEWIWVVGADTLVTNFNLTLEQLVAMAGTAEAEQKPLPEYTRYPELPEGIIHWLAMPEYRSVGKKHLIIAGERVAPVQADSFLVKASEEGKAYVRELLFHHSMYKHHPWVENQTMIDLREKWGAITFIAPQWRLNSYDYTRFYKCGEIYRDGTDCYGNRGQWEKGDFLIHWPAASLAERMNFLQQYSNQIIE